MNWRRNRAVFGLGIVAALGHMAVAGVPAVAGAELARETNFCKVQSKVRVDVATLSTNPAKARKATTAIDRMLKADPPAKVAKALRTIKRAHTRVRAGKEPTASLVDSVDTAGDVLGEYVAVHCLTSAKNTSKPSTGTREPPLTGDAADNAACRLATVAEIEQKVEAGVIEVKGLTSPGAYAENGLSCTWYLDSTDIGIPSVLVQWEYPVDTFHDAVVDLYQSNIDQGLATRVEGIGDFAQLQGATAETVARTNIVRVTVLMHVEPTPTDVQNATDLLQLMLSRAQG